jgi:hypothetical protein
MLGRAVFVDIEGWGVVEVSLMLLIRGSDCLRTADGVESLWAPLKYQYVVRR